MLNENFLSTAALGLLLPVTPLPCSVSPINLLGPYEEDAGADSVSPGKDFSQQFL